jgi:glycosyltransferase involved in cell wall biosynthesis
VKIALVGPVYPYRGGIAHYTGMLARALRELRHETLVVSYRRQYPRRLYPGDSDRDPSLNADAWRVEAEFLLDSVWPPTWWQAAERVRAFGPDVLVLQWWTTFMGPLTWVLARQLRRAGVRVGFVVHNVLPHEPRPGDAWITRRVLRQGQSFLVTSEAELTRLRALLPDVSARVVAHPVQTGFGEAAAAPDAARWRLGLPTDGGVILFFGIVRPYKGLRILLDALAILHAAGEQAHLVVAGEIWDDQHGYERQVEALGLAGFVHLTARYIANEEVPLYFAAADVFAAPYVGGSGGGATVRVARGFGLPIVTTRPEDVAGEPAGPLGAQVVAPADAQALARALGAALTARAATRGLPVAPRGRNGVADWGHLAREVAAMAREA